MQRIVIAGETGNHCLEMSYHNAARQLGMDSYLYDTKAGIHKYARFGKLGVELHRFFPVLSWLRKGNKDFVDFVRSKDPDFIILFTGAEILPGTVAYIKSILKAKIIWYWADPLPNLNNYIYQGVKLTDLLVSYSRSSLPAFQSMGAPRTCWVPFGADLDTHNISKTPLALEYDLSFVGSWRPEREKVLSIIHRNFPELKIRVDGPYWNRCEYNGIRRIANSKPIYGSEFSTIVQQSLISLNVTDTTNFPSANMRFFEIMASGGTQLVSDSDEMKDTFLDKEHVLYFNDEHSLLEKLKFALGNKDEMMRIRSNAYKEVSGNHLYIHRLKEILKYE